MHRSVHVYLKFYFRLESKLNTNNRPTGTRQRAASSNYSRSSNRGRNVGRVRGSTSSLLAGGSRNYVSRSGKGSKSTTAVGSSTHEPGGVVLAVTSGRGDARAEVGIAALDIRCPDLILCQISDTQTYTNTLTKLYLFDPIQVLMPDTMCEPVAGRNMLYRSITEKFPEMQPTPISRIHFNDTIGLERVRTLCAAEYSSVELFVKHKYYALAATAALLKYVEYSQRIVYSPKSIRIEFQGSPNATSIDLDSARSLELVQSQSGQRNVSLLGILDRCSTPMGRKLLRANILQPPCEQRAILDRQSSVAELASNRALRIILQPIVRRLYGADRLTALSTTPVLHENSVQCAEQNLNYVLLLKNMLDTVPELEQALSSAETDLLRRIQKRLGNPRFRLMRERILDTIHPDARFVIGYTSSNMQRCFAIKAGINDLLDVARRTYCELIDDMKSMVENLASKYKLPLSLGCNATQGYHVQAILPRNSGVEVFQLPTEFIEVRKSRRVYTMTTSTLATLSQQCKIASEELHLMSNVLLCDLLQSIRQYVGCLFQLNADMAELDVISSLAQTSSLHAYVRPTFGSQLELLDSRHPVLEAFGLDDPVPNNVCASIPWNFHIVSGPNMSGKSTYLKQVVLLHIMAQIGCFVPAKRAVFRLTNLIFCKIAVRNDIECNASTFVLEMKEAQYILRSVTPTSLVVLDELCKGTAIEEGVSIAWAICERLLNTTAFVFVATHFAYLTKLAGLYCNVTNHCFETITAREQEATPRADGDHSLRYTYTHRLKPGVASTDDYGIVLAELSDLPKSVTKQARNYALEQQMTTVDRISSESSSWEHACHRIVVEMYQLFEGEDEHSVQRQKLGDHVERIRNLRIRRAHENYEQRVEGATKDVNDTNDTSNTNRVHADTTANDSATKGTLDDNPTCENMNIEEIQGSESEPNLASNLDHLTCDNAVSIRSRQSQIERFEFRKISNSSCDRDRDRDASNRRSFNTIAMASTSSCSSITGNLSTKIQRDLNAFDSMKTQCVDNLEKTNSSIDEGALSLSFTSILASPAVHMSMSPASESRITNLHEYCLSDSDFDVELCEKSPPFTPANILFF
ncbi:mutS protein homolog 4 [Halictus rubicundus]|uniref:mutS protein homolog 4 n=1 Tax=Halictus rubicundus TaxID=77578 RepID=UPI004034FC5C